MAAFLTLSQTYLFTIYERIWRSKCQNIVIEVECLWKPLDSFVICFDSFFGPNRAQSSMAFPSFWTYWPIETSH